MDSVCVLRASAILIARGVHVSTIAPITVIVVLMANATASPDGLATIVRCHRASAGADVTASRQR